jgi:hypothetical protein
MTSGPTAAGHWLRPREVSNSHDSSGLDSPGRPELRLLPPRDFRLESSAGGLPPPPYVHLSACYDVRTLWGSRGRIARIPSADRVARLPSPARAASAAMTPSEVPSKKAPVLLRC